MLLVARLTQDTFSEITAQLAMIMLVPYLLVGLAVIHGLVKQAGRGYGWLVAVYLLLAFVPQTTLLPLPPAPPDEVQPNCATPALPLGSRRTPLAARPMRNAS